MATIKVAPPEHPGWTKEPEDEWNSKVIRSHAQGVMSGPAVKNFGNVIRRYELVMLGGSIDQETGVIVVTDGESEVEKSKKEIEEEHHQLKLPKCLARRPHQV